MHENGVEYHRRTPLWPQAYSEAEKKLFETSPLPFRVVRKKRTMVTAHRNGKYITRNVSHLKVIDTRFQGKDEEEEDDNVVLNSNSNSTSNASDANGNPPQNDLRRSTRNRRQVDRFDILFMNNLCFNFFSFFFGTTCFSQSKGGM